jgi:hypothetical protein
MRIPCSCLIRIYCTDLELFKGPDDLDQLFLNICGHSSTLQFFVYGRIAQPKRVVFDRSLPCRGGQYSARHSANYLFSEQASEQFFQMLFIFKGSLTRDFDFRFFS